MEKEKLDVSSENIVKRELLRGFGEINEMRERWRKEDEKRIVKEVERDFSFHKEFLEFKVWAKTGGEALDRKQGNLKHLLTPKENFAIPMDKHHVNETETVYIPTLVHRAISHKAGDGKLEGVIG